MTTKTEIFNPQSATDADFRALNEHFNRLRAETHPDDPPRSLSYTVKNLKSWEKLEDVDVTLCVVWGDEDGSQDGIVAHALTDVAHMNENKHLMGASVEVLPKYRRQGLAKGLLVKVLETAQAENRTLMVGVTNTRVPAGAAFAEKLGAKAGLQAHINQLVLAELEPDLLRRWQENAETTASEFELGLWTIPYPEEEIEAIAAMYEVMNTEPRGELEIEDHTVAPKDLRQDEAYLAARGVERWTFYTKHKPSGELAGYTEVFWDPEEPENVRQGDTGVLPKYRGHGLGKWLKAAMLEKVLRERPQVKRVRTGNADANVPMLAINRALGFKPYLSETVWQLERDKLQAYLANKA